MIMIRNLSRDFSPLPALNHFHFPYISVDLTFFFLREECIAKCKVFMIFDNNVKFERAGKSDKKQNDGNEKINDERDT
jgi:hypothetical protein